MPTANRFARLALVAAIAAAGCFTAAANEIERPLACTVLSTAELGEILASPTVLEEVKETGETSSTCEFRTDDKRDHATRYILISLTHAPSPAMAKALYDQVIDLSKGSDYPNEPMAGLGDEAVYRDTAGTRSVMILNGPRLIYTQGFGLKKAPMLSAARLLAARFTDAPPAP